MTTHVPRRFSYRIVGGHSLDCATLRGGCIATDGTGLSRIESVTLTPDANFISMSWTPKYDTVTKYLIKYTTDGSTYFPVYGVGKNGTNAGTHTY